jgi:hypothetical protein
MKDEQASPLTWTSGPEGLRFGALLVSFQRYSIPTGGVVSGAPRSLGALPIAVAPSGFLLPVGDDEAFWIGVIVPEVPHFDPLWVTALLPDETEVLIANVSGAQTRVLAGLIRADGQLNVFCRSSLGGLRMSVADQTAFVRSIDPKTYSETTGRPAPMPLDPSAAYGGWRLP